MSMTRYSVRVEESDIKEFRETSRSKYGKDHNDFFREIVIAANEGRLRIIPTKEQLTTLTENKELYNVK